MKKQLSNALILLLFFGLITSAFIYFRLANGALVNKARQQKNITELPAYKDAPEEKDYNSGRCSKCGMTVYRKYFDEHLKNCGKGK